MFIGIDLGTSSIKMILINHDQNIIATAHEKLRVISPQDGYNEQNPVEWILASEKCLAIFQYFIVLNCESVSS